MFEMAREENSIFPRNTTRILQSLFDDRVSAADAVDLVSSHLALASAAREITAGYLPVRSRGKRLLSRALEQIDADAAGGDILSAWSMSTTVDEHAGAAVIPDWFGEMIHQRAGLPFHRDLAHAGLTHTYGYLFSDTVTPYGLKRDRWVNGDIAAVLGIDRRWLTGNPAAGTLLGNATYCFASIAGFTTVPPSAHLDGAIAPDRFDLSLITESATHEQAGDDRRPLDEPIVIRTYLARPIDPPRAPDKTLLVYTVERSGLELLVTGFAVHDSYAQSLLDEDPGDRIALRFNARMHGVGTLLIGSRSVARNSNG